MAVPIALAAGWLSATATVAASVAPPFSLAVDWPAFLGRADPVWSWAPADPASLPGEWVKSLFGGNGNLGFMVWAPDFQSLHIDIGRTDLYDDRTPDMAAFMNNFAFDAPRLPIGHFVLTWRGTLLNATGRIGLFDGLVTVTLTTTLGTLNLTAWSNAEWEAADVTVLETVATAGAEAWSAQFVPEVAQSTWSGQSSAYVPNPPPLNASTAPAPGAVLNLTTQPHLKGTAHTTAVLQLALASGGTSSGGSSVVYFVSVSPVLDDAASSDAWASGQVLAADATGLDGLRAAHSAWWHAYWPAGGFLTLDDSVLESFWWLQQYKLACAARAGRVVHDLEGPWFVAGTNWPDLHWDMNLQQTYYLPLNSNRMGAASTLTDFMQALHASGNLNTNVPAAWRGDSAAAPTGASSLSGNMSCYWSYGPNCTTAPPSVTGNLLWACQLLHLVARYSGNDTVATAVLWPLLGRALQAYQHFQLAANASGDGLVHLPPTFSPEYPGPVGPDANYDLSLYRWGLGTAAALAARYNLSSPHLPAWRATLAALASYSVDVASGTYEIYAGTPYATPHRHYSHLFMVWPLRLTNLTQAAWHATAKRSVDRWLATPEEDSQFYRPAASAMNVMLRQAAAAFDNVTYLLRTRIEANTMYREGAAGACTETPVAAAWAVGDWLLGSWNASSPVLAAAGLGGGNGTTVLEPYPGIDDVIPLTDGAYAAAPAAAATAAFFRLRAEGAFLVSAARRVVSRNATHLVTATAFVGIESDSGGGGGPCVLRLAGMPRPLVALPASVRLTELGDGGLVAVGIGAGESVAVYSQAYVPPQLVVSAAAGCPADFNHWGWGGGGGSTTAAVGAGGGLLQRARASAARIAAAAGATKVTLQPCQYTDGGEGHAVVPSQRFAYDAASLAFQLQDGSGSCLAVSTCAADNGDLVATAPCAAAPNSSAPLGCAPGCAAAAQQWTMTGAAGSPPNALRTGVNGRCLDVHGAFDPDTIDVWDCNDPPGADANEEWSFNASSGAIQSLDTNACCHLLCLTVAPASGGDA